MGPHGKRTHVDSNPRPPEQITVALPTELQDEGNPWGDFHTWPDGDDRRNF